MDQYYLFRGNELIYKTEPGVLIGCGDAYAHGQPGDVLILIERNKMTGYRWQKGDQMDQQAHWGSIEDRDLDPNYRVWILLQQ